MYSKFKTKLSTSIHIRVRIRKELFLDENILRGSAAHIMFLASNICCVSSGTVNARYCCEPRDVSGAKPFMKKCRRGNGTMFVPSLRRSQLSWPGKRMEHVMPDKPADTRWLRSPYVGVVSFNVLKHMSYLKSREIIIGPPPQTNYSKKRNDKRRIR